MSFCNILLINSQLLHNSQNWNSRIREEEGERGEQEPE
jgi:hypothetical protein